MPTLESNSSAAGGSLGNRLSFKMDIRAYTMILALVGIWIAFIVLTEGKFIIARNISNLSRQMSITAVLAIGMVMIIVATHIDLSVGSVLGLTGGLAAILQVWHHVPTPWAILAALALGALIGAWHGFWVAYQRVPAFIVTLAGYMSYRGILMGISKCTTVALSDQGFKMLSNGYLGPIQGFVLTILVILAFSIGRIRARASRIKYGFPIHSLSLEILIITATNLLIVFASWYLYRYEGIPFPIIWVLILVTVFTFLANNTRFGRQVYAMGGNAEAARLSGVNIRRQTVLVFILAGLLAAFAGVLTTARLGAATITAGQGAEMDAIASCIIGGTSLMGGVGSIPGAILGALVMASLDNGMSMLNTAPYWQLIIKGFVLLMAVWVDFKTKK